MTRKEGFAPIWIILLTALLGGIFVVGRSYVKLPSRNSNLNSSKASSTTQSTNKKLSLREVCLDKIKDVPAPPFSYASKKTMDTLLPSYKAKERFSNQEKASACVTDYSIWAVKEQAFRDMGFDYYKFNKTIGKNLLNYPAINSQFNPAVDRAYTLLMGAKNWKKISRNGEKYGGLPYIVYFKEEGVYKMYVDITQGTDQYFFVTLTVIGQ